MLLHWLEVCVRVSVTQRFLRVRVCGRARLESTSAGGGRRETSAASTMHSNPGTHNSMSVRQVCLLRNFCDIFGGFNTRQSEF